MRAFWVLFRVRVAELWRRPMSLVWFYLVPLLLVALVGGLFASGHPFEDRRVVWLVAPAEETHFAAQRGKLDAQLGIRIENGHSKGGAVARQRLASREIAAILVQECETLQVEVGEKDALFGRGLAALVEGELLVVPQPRYGYLQFLLPGLLAQAIFVAGLFGLGYALARYRQSRLLQKLRTTPLSPATFVLALAAGRWVLVLGQLVLVLLAGSVAFGLHLTALQMALALAVGSLGLAAFLGLGFALAAMIESEDLLGDVIAALGIPIALLSGMFFSVDALPSWLGVVARALPSTLLVTALRQILVHGDLAIGMAIAQLGAWTVGLWALAIGRFRWR